ncbi:uncharacterized protein [Clytia hemisphaerica]|uniref:Uncharacterized protein n=1 Tax=Clytia hemisphaerica TaxID=252671 RepID=A0A7M5UWE6_9CNID
MDFKSFFFVLLFLFANQTTAGREHDDFPKDDYKTFFKDLNEALGLEQLLDTIGFYFRTYIRIGQAYTWQKFNNDWKDLQTSPSVFKLFHFIHKLFWVAISQTGVKLIHAMRDGQVFLLHFLKKKCDKTLDKNSALHPWNVLMEQNEQSVSFLVFVYGLMISLILIKILSWWNFMVYLAFGFLVYSFGGPYMVFKWLLTITALVWFIFDFVLTYPFQTAIAILTLYGMVHITWLLRSIVNLIFGRSDTPPPTPRHYRDYPDASPPRDRHRAEGEFTELTNRIDGMERRTELLNDRLDQLSRSMERVLQNMGDEDSD